jgi:hypothetical protein
MERTGPAVCTIDSDVSQAGRGGGGDTAATQAKLTDHGHTSGYKTGGRQGAAYGGRGTKAAEQINGVPTQHGLRARAGR